MASPLGAPVLRMADGLEDERTSTASLLVAPRGKVTDPATHKNFQVLYNGLPMRFRIRKAPLTRVFLNKTEFGDMVTLNFNITDEPELLGFLEDLDADLNVALTKCLEQMGVKKAAQKHTKVASIITKSGNTYWTPRIGGLLKAEFADDTPAYIGKPGNDTKALLDDHYGNYDGISRVVSLSIDYAPKTGGPPKAYSHIATEYLKQLDAAESTAELNPFVGGFSLGSAPLKPAEEEEGGLSVRASSASQAAQPSNPAAAAAALLEPPPRAKRARVAESS